MMKYSKILAAIFASLFLASSANLAWATKSVKHQKAGNYKNAHVKGCFVGTLAGFVLPNPADPTFQIPTSILVRYCGDGRGSATAETTQTVGGVCTVETAGKADYTVEKTGIGTVTANLQITEVIDPFGACASTDSRLSQGTKAIFELKFGIERKGCQPVIALSLTPEPGPAIPLVAQGRSCRQ